jgi:20S proteasome subunit alpha 6
LTVATLDQLITHGLLAIRDTLQQEKVVNTENVTVAYVGPDTKFTIIDGTDLER